MHRSTRFLFACFVTALTLGWAALAGRPAETPAAPETQTVMVEMRDGVRLATDVHLPPGDGPFPVVLLRTPYNREGAAGIARDGTRRGYAVVAQDTRGRFGSEGENLPFHGDWWGGPTDGLDTVEWVARQPWCNGKIGTMGGSALGITQLGMVAAGASTPGGALAAQHIVVGAPSLYHDCFYPGGIFKKAMIEDWLQATEHGEESLPTILSHPTFDSYWAERSLEGRWNRANIPAVHLGGWYDIFAQGTIDSFVGYQSRGGHGARGNQKLIMGPWPHAVLRDTAGELTFPNGGSPPGSAHNHWEWFDGQLKGLSTSATVQPAVTYYTMGDVSDPEAPGNEWRTAPRWPPVRAIETRYFLTGEQGLARSRPLPSEPLSYVYDPQNPVPTVGGLQLTLPAGPMDQRAVEERDDVLLFTSDPLEEPVELTGRFQARLFFETDVPDTDFFVKVCDVYPDGRSINIVEGQRRARFRRSYRSEELLEPDRVHSIDVDLWSSSIVLNQGHRIRVQITSSSFPGYDPNPNTGEPLRANNATRIAHTRIHVGGRYPSHVLLPVRLESVRRN